MLRSYLRRHAYLLSLANFGWHPQPADFRRLHPHLLHWGPHRDILLFRGTSPYRMT